MSELFKILWPDERYVGPATIENWYHDAVDNGELDRDAVGLSNVDEMAVALHRAGTITLGVLP